MAHGYAVAVPQRPGHGKTGGPYYEDQGASARSADFRKAGLGTAASIAAAIDYMTHQRFVQKTGVLAIGQSAGGWGALALASQHYPPLKAVVAFAPGRGGRVNGEANRNCAPDRLIAAARQFGEQTRIPSLWIYAENDSYFGPDLSRRLADAYRLAGGRAEYHLLPAVGSDGHNLDRTIADAEKLWAPLLEKFLEASADVSGRARLNRHGFLAPLLPLAVGGVEQLLAQPDRLRRHLDQLVVLDIGQRLFQRHADRRGQPHRLVLDWWCGCW